MAVIGKLEAAERLIRSGVKMLDRGDDPLAIHLVASSGLNLLREFIGTGGSDYLRRILQEGAFLAAQAKIKGSPSQLPESPEIDQMITHIADGIEAGVVTEPGDVAVKGSNAEVRGLLDYIMKPYNFLKHADRDPLDTRDESDFDPEGALQHAITAYLMARGDGELPDDFLDFLVKRDLI